MNLTYKQYLKAIFKYTMIVALPVAIFAGGLCLPILALENYASLPKWANITALFLWAPVWFAFCGAGICKALDRWAS